MTDTKNSNNQTQVEPTQTAAAAGGDDPNNASDDISIPSQHSSVKNPSLKTADRSDHEDTNLNQNPSVETGVLASDAAKNNNFQPDNNDQNEMVNTGSGANDFKAQNLDNLASALNQEEIEDKMRQRREKRRQEKEAAERERKKKELQK